MEIKVLNTACCGSNSLEKRVRQIVNGAGIDASIEKIEDLEEITKLGVMSTPALLVDGAVKVSGRTPSTEEIANLLTAS